MVLYNVTRGYQNGVPYNGVPLNAIGSPYSNVENVHFECGKSWDTTGTIIGQSWNIHAIGLLA
jgi:hypothetical protein